MNADLLDDPALPPFCDPFDAALARSGPPALFTVDHSGRLRLDPDRTRDGWSRLEAAPARQPTVFLLRDRATGWVQLALATAPELLAAHPRAEAHAFPSVGAALEALRSLGPLPVFKGEWNSGGDVR